MLWNQTYMYTLMFNYFTEITFIATHRIQFSHRFLSLLKDLNLTLIYKAIFDTEFSQMEYEKIYASSSSVI